MTDFKGKKAVVGLGPAQAVDLTPEEAVQRQADAAAHDAEVQASTLEAARLQAMQDDADALAIIEQLTTKTNLEIDTFIDNADAAQMKRVVAGILKVIAYKLR